jgi:hypothetical protein
MDPSAYNVDNFYNKIYFETSNEFEEARTLERDTQFKMLKRVSDYLIEKVEL